MTVNQMRDQIDAYMNLHKGQKTMITLDKMLIFRKTNKIKCVPIYYNNITKD